MLPDDIEEIALVAIKNNEYKTLEYVIDHLRRWMACGPDKVTARVAWHIVDAAYKSNDDSLNELVRGLFTYAYETLIR